MEVKMWIFVAFMITQLVVGWEQMQNWRKYHVVDKANNWTRLWFAISSLSLFLAAMFILISMVEVAGWCMLVAGFCGIMIYTTGNR